MYNWLLQTLSDVLNDCEERSGDNTKVLPENRSIAQLKAQREWFGAIAAAENLLESTINSNKETPQGIVFSSPVPVFNNMALVSRLQTGIFTTEAFQFKALMPSSEKSQSHHTQLWDDFSLGKLPLIPNDPIAKEQFCLIFTDAFALVLVLGTNKVGTPQFHFSFAPETIERVWQTLRSRLVLVNYQDLSRIDSLIEEFKASYPDYRLVSRFSRKLLQNLPNLTNFALEKEKTRNIDLAASGSHSNTVESNALSNNGELERELLQALTHEIRTPLTTIRTLTKLLLKKKQEFQPKVIQRLQAIDRECTEQIERMELIFRAAELEATPVSQKSVHLTPCCLESVLQQTIPRWEEQAQRRNVNLDVSVPQHLPEVVSDPAMLDRVLTGLMESCTRSLTTGDKIRVHVSTAGDRLKLRVISQSDNSKNPFKSLGHLLMFQPGTGCLSLNWDVTKQMFQAMGGKLTVRQRARQEKELTIFLPLGKKVNNTRQTG